MSIDQVRSCWMAFSGVVILSLTLFISRAVGQTANVSGRNQRSPVVLQASEASQSDAPLTITFQDALERARANSLNFQAALTALGVARQNRLQARASLLPSVDYDQEYLNTQGNGVLPSGRFVTNDGVHVYRIWGVFRQSVDWNTLTLTGYKQASIAEAIARAEAEIARRGLRVAVTQAYYVLVGSQRKYATAQESLRQAEDFLKISQELESGGEVARSDVIKFQLQANQQDQAFREAKLAMETARLDLAVMLFPDFNQNFTVVDDLDSAQPLPEFAEVSQMAEKNNPEVRAALEAARTAGLEVSAARAAYLPRLSLTLDYGIEANALALRSRASVAPERGRLPNLGYFLTATLSFPVWNWGVTRSKIRQAEFRRSLARVQLAFAQRELLRNLYAYYNEAETARLELDKLRASASLAAESLRLNTLRYKAGEATVLEVVDAQNALTQARDSYDDGLLRYRVTVARLQTVTGAF